MTTTSSILAAHIEPGADGEVWAADCSAEEAGEGEQVPLHPPVGWGSALQDGHLQRVHCHPHAGWSEEE